MKVTKVAETRLPTPFGTFRLFGFETEDKSESVVVLVMGDVKGAEAQARQGAALSDDAALLRIHSQCLTGDVFGSGRCDCGDQLHFAMEKIAARGVGILIYQLQEGRGIGLMNKLLAYELQDSGHDTVEANEHLGFEADHRNYELCAEVLRYLDVSRVRLMSNNPLKFDSLEAAGIQIAERIPIEIAPSDGTEKYLKTKKAKLGHMLSKV
jgi:3,4-dihydroxy 2-butanone 4-phosphate synthase/GTP cyclohydrolase II